MTSSSDLTPDQQQRVDRVTDARIRDVEESQYSTVGPIPLEPGSIEVRVVHCDVCGPNGRAVPDPDDPEDSGIRGCCEGYGVRLAVPAGLEPLLLRMAAREAGNWAAANRGQQGVFSDSWADTIEDEMLRVLTYRPPHREGAAVAGSWPGSDEEASALQRLDAR